MTQQFHEEVCEAERVVKSLEGVMRNVGGPNSQKRKSNDCYLAVCST